MELTKYLFCYFTGNLPEEEAVHFAVSADGYHFKALNYNRPVIKQKLGKKSCRDPFLFRDNDNTFHIAATDMRCHDGWNSNSSIVLWDSKDLIHWENERIIDFSQFEKTKNADRVWAPEIMYDKEKSSYMLYWTHNNTDDDLDSVTWYAYTKDFKTMITQPEVLFKPKSNMCAVDADIIEKDGKYYLYEADGEKKGICYAVSDHLSGPYFEPKSNLASGANTALEGNCIYKILGTDKYAMIADQFVAGGYFMQETTDLIHFKRVKDFSLNHLRPRHGSVLHITDEEYNRITNNWKLSDFVQK